MIERPALLLAAVAVAACAGAALPIATTPGPGDNHSGSAAVVPARLWLEQADGSSRRIGVVDVGTGRVALSMPMGVLSGDGSRLYAVVVKGITTLLQAIDAGTGEVRESMPIPSGFRLPALGPGARPIGLSPDGHHLAMVSNDVTGDQVTRTHLLIYDTRALARRPTTVDLGGNFDFDGLSNDDHNLYLIENPGGPTPDGGYHIRRYDLAGGGLDPNIVADKRTGEQAMGGSPIDQVVAGGGSWQFTVYAFGMGAPFVHALNLDAGVAYCIDLPRAPRDEVDLLWAVVASSDGSHVYAVNAASGAVMEMDSNSPWQNRERSLTTPPAGAPAVAMPWQAISADAKRITHGAAAISGDDRTLYVLADHGIAVIDTAGLRIRATLVPGRALASLRLSADGMHLYAVGDEADDRPLQIDVNGGGWTPLGVTGHSLAVLRVLP